MAKLFIERLNVDASTWTPVTIPNNCREWTLRNKSGPTWVRSTPTDASSQDDFDQMDQYYVASQAQFSVGQIPCYLKLPDGTMGAQVVVFTVVLLG